MTADVRHTPIPAGWTRYRRLNGIFKKPFRDGTLCHVPSANLWFLSIPRGIGTGYRLKGTGDGPFGAVIAATEDEAIAFLTPIYEELEAAGWLDIDCIGNDCDTGGQNRLRIIRCFSNQAAIPAYLQG